VSVLVVGAVATWAMVGLVWTVQLVHYPMLATRSAQAPVDAMVDHQRRITWLVGPLMGTETVTTRGHRRDAARRTHDPKVAGSDPAPATNQLRNGSRPQRFAAVGGAMFSP